MTVCVVTGNIRSISNEIRPGAQIVFARRSVIGQDGKVVAADPITVTSDSNGDLTVNLFPGNYRATYRGVTGSYVFTAAVPDAASASLAAIINAADITLSSQLLADAQLAQGLAQEWASNPLSDDVTGYPGQFSALHHATNADADAVAAAADRVQTGLDRVQTGLDRVQTGLDRVATAADRVVTTSDRIAAQTARTGAETAFASTLALNPFDQPVEALHPLTIGAVTPALPSGWWDTGLRMSIAATSPFTTSTSVLALISNWGGVHLFGAGQLGANFDMTNVGRVFGADGVTAPAIGAGAALVLDDHRGASLGAELVANPTPNFNLTTVNYNPVVSVVANKAYLIDYTVSANSGSTSASWRINGNGFSGSPNGVNAGQTGRIRDVFIAPSSGSFILAADNVGVNLTISLCSIKELLIPAIWQPSASLRPVLGRAPASRRNLLQYSEDFSNGEWQKLASGTGSVPVVTTNYGLDPNGNMAADRVVFNRGAGVTSGDISRIFQEVPDPATGVGVVAFYVRSTDGVSSYSMRLFSGFDETNITITGSWQRFACASSGTIINAQLGLMGSQNQQNADVLVWGAQGEHGSTATAYQKVVSNLDITEAGAASYNFLRPDLSDDVLPIINPVAIPSGKLFIMGRNGSWEEDCAVTAGQTVNIGPTGTLATPGILRATGDIVDTMIRPAMTAEEKARFMRKYRAEGAAGWLVEGANLAGADITGAGWGVDGGAPAATRSGNQITFAGQYSHWRFFVVPDRPGQLFRHTFTIRRISGNYGLSFYLDNTDITPAAGAAAANITITDTAQTYSILVMRHTMGNVSLGLQDRNASGHGVVEITNPILTKFNPEAAS